MSKFVSVVAVVVMVAAGFAGRVQAQTTCTQVGNQTFCNDARGGGTVTCTQVGNQTFCN